MDFTALWPGGCWEMSFNRGCRASLRVEPLSLEVFVDRVSAQPWCCSETARDSETLPQCQQLSLARLGAASQTVQVGFSGARSCTEPLHRIPPARLGRALPSSGACPPGHRRVGSIPPGRAASAFIPISLGGEKRLRAQAGPRAAASPPPQMEIGTASRRGLLPWEAWQGGTGCPPTSTRLLGDILYPSGLAAVGRNLQLGSVLSPLWISSSWACWHPGAACRRAGSAGSWSPSICSASPGRDGFCLRSRLAPAAAHSPLPAASLPSSVPTMLTAASLASPRDVTVPLPPPRLNSHPRCRAALPHGEEGSRHPTAPPGPSSSMLLHLFWTHITSSCLQDRACSTSPCPGCSWVPHSSAGQGRPWGGCPAEQTLPQDTGRCCWMLPRPAGMEESPQQPQPSSDAQGPPPWLQYQPWQLPRERRATWLQWGHCHPPCPAARWHLVAPLPGRGTSFPPRPSPALGPG